MMQTLRCPHGHEWEAADSSSTSGVSANCPVCGSQGTATQVDAHETIAAPLEELLASEAVTKAKDPATTERGKNAEVAKLEATHPMPASNAAAAEVVKAERAPVESVAPLTIAPTAEEISLADFVPEAPNVPGYEILAELGRGGMGVVYKARQQSLDRLVALKMILSGAHAGTTELARFRTEAEAVAKLQHPNIVQIYEVGTQAGAPYFSLEYVDGGTLAQKLAQTPQLPRAAAQFTATLARAVFVAHSRGIIHRDLKPANILLGPVPGRQANKKAEGSLDPRQWTLKITDFGLAKRLDSESSQTQSGTLLGTPSYMAPEQADGRGQLITPAADIYSLGAILYEFLTGRPPFRGVSLLDTISQVVKQEPVPPSRLQPKVPRDLETICLKCLEKDPRKRYATAQALAEDLDLFLANRPIRARPVGPIERAWKWSRRRPAAAALIASSLFLILGLAVGGFWFARHEHVRAVAEETLRNDAEQSKAIAIKERDIAETQERKAAKNYQLARNAVDQMLTRIGQERLANEPHMEEVRRDLLEKALAFYQQFLREKSTDPQTIADTAQSSARVGDIQELLGRPRQAEQSYVEAIALFNQLREPAPAARHDLAASYNNLGILLHSEGQRTRAEQALRQALSLKQGLVRDFPDNADYSWSLAKTENNWANFLQTGNRLADAEQAYLAAASLLDKLIARQAGEPGYRQEMAVSRLNHGTLLMLTGRRDDAAREFDEALATQSKLIARFPNRPEYQKEEARIYLCQAVLAQLGSDGNHAKRGYDRAAQILKKLAERYPLTSEYRHELAKVYRNLGNLERDASQPRPAEADYRRAIEILSKLVEETPLVPLHRLELARTENEFALLLAQAKRSADAEANWSRARKLYDQLANDFPDEPLYRKDLADVEGNLGILLTQAQRWPEARAAYDRAVALLEDLDARFPSVASDWRAPFARDLLKHEANLGNLQAALGQSQSASKTWDKVADVMQKLCDLHDVEEAQPAIIEVVDMAPADLAPLGRIASILAQFRGQVESQPALAPTRRRELVASYQNLALKLLKQAIAAGAIEPSALKSPAFDPIRTVPQFATLAAELDQKKR